jgi:hypothetical protein
MKSVILTLHGDVSPLFSVDQDQVHLLGEWCPDSPQNRVLYTRDRSRSAHRRVPVRPAHTESPDVDPKGPGGFRATYAHPRTRLIYEDRLCAFQHASFVPSGLAPRKYEENRSAPLWDIHRFLSDGWPTKSEAKSDVALSRQVHWWVSFHVAENAQMPYDHEPTYFTGD